MKSKIEYSGNGAFTKRAPANSDLPDKHVYVFGVYCMSRAILSDKVYGEIIPGIPDSLRLESVIDDVLFK